MAEDTKDVVSTTSWRVVCTAFSELPRTRAPIAYSSFVAIVTKASILAGKQQQNFM